MSRQEYVELQQRAGSIDASISRDEETHSAIQSAEFSDNEHVTSSMPDQAQSNETTHPEEQHKTEEETMMLIRGIPSISRKLGKMAIFILLSGTLLILIAIGFLAFLWFANSENSLWHSIIVRDWLVKASTISSEVVKQAVTFQLGIVGAVLAALALERFQVSLPDVAAVSMMRAGTGSGQLVSLLRKRLHRRCFTNKQFGISFLVLTSTTILGMIQAVTIVLVSDIGLESLPGKPSSKQLNIGFVYRTENYTNVPQSEVLDRGTTWSRKPPYYPTFAEYTEPPFVQDGVDDTGVTLRAFLPFLASEDRQTVRSYSGRTTVLDARVTCQVPLLSHETLQLADDDSTMVFTGSVQASRSTPKLQNSVLGYTIPSSGDGPNIFHNDWNQSVPFQCLAPIAGDGSADSKATWRTTICQLPIFSGGLGSEFLPDALPDPSGANFYANSYYGTSYLIMNITLGSEETWAAVTGGAPAFPPEYGQTGEWLDLVYSNGELIFGVTLCYSAFRTADIPISISSEYNRTEPTASFDFTASKYTFSGIREQLGQVSDDAPLWERGVLQLNKEPSWLANNSELPPVEPFIRDFANMKGPTGEGNIGNYTAFLWDVGNQGNQSFSYIQPDQMHFWLFQEIVTTGGSVAFALQSLITVLSSMAYYDQISQFDNLQAADIVDFITANTPRRYWGFLAVCILLLVHILLVTIVLVRFARGTRFSMLGNAWQVISQSMTEETKEYIVAASMMTDSEVEESMEADGLKNLVLGVGSIGASGKVGVVKRI